MFYSLNSEYTQVEKWRKKSIHSKQHQNTEKWIPWHERSLRRIFSLGRKKRKGNLLCVFFFLFSSLLAFCICCQMMYAITNVCIIFIAFLSIATAWIFFDYRYLHTCFLLTRFPKIKKDCFRFLFFCIPMFKIFILSNILNTVYDWLLMFDIFVICCVWFSVYFFFVQLLFVRFFWFPIHNMDLCIKKK